MSKFTIKVKLEKLEIEVEGSREDAPLIAKRVGQQMGGLLQPALLATGNGNAPANVVDAEVETENGAGKKKKGKKTGGRTAAELLNFVHDPSQYGSPLQAWTTTQKAIWFLHVVGKQANVTQLTGTNIANNFNKFFKVSGAINSGNVITGRERERLKGANSTVGADQTDGTAKYFLTQSGTTLAERLGRGEAIAD